MKRITLAGMVLLCIILSGCKMHKDAPRTVKSVDLDRYTGLWYEIASYPNRFQQGCHCTTAEYTMAASGKYIIVKNRCNKDSPTGPESSIEGKAFVVKDSGNAKLKVQFFWPFRAPYWIVGLADDYSWALVSGPSRKYLWILARNPEMDQNTYNDIITQLQKMGFDTDKLKESEQAT